MLHVNGCAEGRRKYCSRNLILKRLNSVKAVWLCWILETDWTNDNKRRWTNV